MADRYQNRQYPAADGFARDPRATGEGDPLAELARLIGQNDPFASREASAPRHDESAYHDAPDDSADMSPPGPPPWMQRVAAREAQQHDYAPEPQVDHYAADHDQADPYQADPYRADQYGEVQPEAGHEYHQAPVYAAADHHLGQSHDHLDPNRYDDALYGQADDAHAQYQPEETYHDPYGYQDGYAEPEQAPKRRSGVMTVAAILALAVVGTGGAYAYRTFVGSSRSGEPPVIKADPGPNKIIPPSATASADSTKQIQDRLSGTERMVSREEQPVNVQDASKAGGPRVVFPPLNQNTNPPSTASVSPANKSMVGNGAMQGGDEPRRVRTVSIRGDQSDASIATPAARQAPARITAPATTPAPMAAPRAANAPMSLSPQGAAPAAPAPARVASVNPAQQIAPAATSGGYVVQISSQRSESDAQASFRALQGKFPSVLGSRTPLIKRADLGEKGTYYRAMVGPFGTPDEASQFCGNLKSAGGQCVVQRN